MTTSAVFYLCSMAKRHHLKLSAYQSVEAGKDHNGRYFVAYSSGASVFIRDIRELRKFLKVPRSIAMRETLDAWLAELEEADKKKTTLEVVGDANVEGSWDPKAHEDDPALSTRMVI